MWPLNIMPNFKFTHDFLIPPVPILVDLLLILINPLGTASANIQPRIWLVNALTFK